MLRNLMNSLFREVEGVSLRITDPLENMQDSLETLKEINLREMLDVQEYAKELLDIYHRALTNVDRELGYVYGRAGSFSQRRPMYPAVVDNVRYNALILAVKAKVAYARHQAGTIKKSRIFQRFQQELSGESVDVRTLLKTVILKTPEGIYGFYLNRPDRGIRRAFSLGLTYLLGEKVVEIE